MITIKELQQVKKKLHRMGIPKKLYQIHSIPVWHMMREYTCFCFAKWTDDELNNYNKNTGFIGNKCGVDCYVSIMINLND